VEGVEVEGGALAARVVPEMRFHQEGELAVDPHALRGAQAQLAALLPPGGRARALGGRRVLAVSAARRRRARAAERESACAG